MVSLDGTLRYIPLAALHDGEHYLIERYALTVFTEVGRENLKVARTPDWRGIGLGVSLAHADVGLTHRQFNALPTVPEELGGIIREEDRSDPEGVLPGRIFLDAAFTDTILRKALRYPVLHIASHFSLRPGDESLSFLLLGDGKPLELRQLRQDNYDFGSVDLLTLSACETAVGGRDAQGQEVEGLGALAQKQGAKGVIATLWPVEDASTGALMQRFYRLHQEKQLSKAEALRQAQLVFLSGQVHGHPGEGRGRILSVAPGSGKPERPSAHDYRHPYYWAPFILMGNWL
jgi:CHAT domain-containing protein